MSESLDTYNNIIHWKLRRVEQHAYMDELQARYLRREISLETRTELLASAKGVLTIINNRIYDLGLQQTISGREAYQLP